MKYVLWPSLIFVFLLGAATASPGVERAQKSFWSGKFGTAAATYKNLLETYPRQADLWFNLGTSEAQAGRMGRATHALETALWLQPDHRDARFNLDAVKAWVLDKALARSQSGTLILPGSDDLGTGLLSAIPLTPIRITFAVSWCLLFLCLSLLRRTIRRRASLSLLLIITGLVATCAGGLLISRSYIIDDSRYGILLDDATAYRGPGQQYDTQAQVSNSVKVRLGGEDGNWRQVTLPNGQGAWIKGEYLAQIGSED
ncbi:MAG: hypothetical protein CMH52_08630 [Myxococcales bacterium]|nr:hypothetical protein [Myxococcales bacterium]